MKSKKKHTNQDFEVVDGIGKYMDDDIQRIIEGKQLELGDRELPPFDEYRIYKNIQEAVMREEKRKNRRIRMPLFFKWTVACAIVLLVIGVGYNFYQSRSEANLVYREVCAVRGEKLLVLLPDGSRVWLNADSKLTYPEQFAKYNRNVTLEGEAYFEIAENKKSPFQVLAENVKIQVTGTCFNVKAYASDKVIKTTLDEGSINIGHVQSRRPMQQMLPGQTAVYEKRSNVIKIKTGAKIYDTTSGFRAVDSKIIKIFAESYPREYPEPISTVDILKQGLVVKEQPVNMHERTAGTSSIKSWKTAYYMINVILSILLMKGRNK